MPELPRRYILPYYRRNKSLDLYIDRIRLLLGLSSWLANIMPRRL